MIEGLNIDNGWRRWLLEAEKFAEGLLHIFVPPAINNRIDPSLEVVTCFVDVYTVEYITGRMNCTSR